MNKSQKIVFYFITFFIIFPTFDKCFLDHVTWHFFDRKKAHYTTYDFFRRPFNFVANKIGSNVFWKMYSPVGRVARSLKYYGVKGKEVTSLSFSNVENIQEKGLLWSQFSNNAFSKINKLVLDTTIAKNRELLGQYLCNYELQENNIKFEKIEVWQESANIPDLKNNKNWDFKSVEKEKSRILEFDCHDFKKVSPFNA